MSLEVWGAPEETSWSTWSLGLDGKGGAFPCEGSGDGQEGQKRHSNDIL